MGTSKNLPYGRLPMTNIIYCVVKPCNTSSITAVCRLENDICHIRNSARVPVFREPLMKFSLIILNIKKLIKEQRLFLFILIISSSWSSLHSYNYYFAECYVFFSDEKIRQ